MDNEMISQLQFDRIKKEIQARAIGNYSKKRISDMTVSTNLQTVLDRQEETREARLILESSQHVPFMGLPRIDALTEQVKKGLILQPTDLIEYADFLRSSRMITKFFDKNQYQTPLLFAYSKHLPDLINVEELIDQKIKNNKVSDDASRNLRKVRWEGAGLYTKRKQGTSLALQHAQSRGCALALIELRCERSWGPPADS